MKQKKKTEIRTPKLMGVFPVTNATRKSHETFRELEERIKRGEKIYYFDLGLGELNNEIFNSEK